MKPSTKISTLFVSALGILTFNFVTSSPASASIACEENTISKYANGSVSSCRLAYDTNVQRYHSRSGTLSFKCKAKEYINFDQKGQITYCYLAEDIEIRQDGYTRKCSADFPINISEYEKGLSVNCY